MEERDVEEAQVNGVVEGAHRGIYHIRVHIPCMYVSKVQLKRFGLSYIGPKLLNLFHNFSRAPLERYTSQNKIKNKFLFDLYGHQRKCIF